MFFVSNNCSELKRYVLLLQWISHSAMAVLYVGVLAKRSCFRLVTTFLSWKIIRFPFFLTLSLLIYVWILPFEIVPIFSHRADLSGVLQAVSNIGSKTKDRKIGRIRVSLIIEIRSFRKERVVREG